MKLLIFIGLKIVEIVGFVFVPYWLGKFTYKKLEIYNGIGSLYPPRWVAGVFVILLGIAIILVGYWLGYSFIWLNWYLAGEILSRLND